MNLSKWIEKEFEETPATFRTILSPVFSVITSDYSNCLNRESLPFAPGEGIFPTFFEAGFFSRGRGSASSLAALDSTRDSHTDRELVSNLQLLSYERGLAHGK
jgi:hypothetical protein